MKQIFLDTETTGLDYKSGHKLIEIACVEIENRKFTGREFQSYVNPNRNIDPGAVKVHGLSQEFLSDKPLFIDIYLDLLKFIKGAELLIHNAEFDLGFINNELALNNIPDRVEDHAGKITDTLLMARQIHPGQRNSLEVLTDRYNVQGYDRSYHGALVDSKILGEVYLSMTGGQTDLKFSPSQQSYNNNQALKTNESKPLVRIKATEEENNLHQEYLLSINKNEN
jgi:DNA polymerase-3 subunit epsilon|tara:strand:+ start:848 stop:1522 length:675 start_codon:yes stop_codon:yes gene_type:complete